MKKQLSKSILNTLSKRVFMFLLMGFTSLSVFAQTGAQLSGRVLDEKGIGLPGATVLEKGTSNGTTTDLDGGFNLKLSGESAQLVVSFIGYVPKEILVGSQTKFSVDMEIDAQSLEEVIVVGYGEQTKQTLTGAVEQVKSEAFESRAVTNPALALQGQTPGLVVTRSSARPGNDGIDLQIRGFTSINQAEPLCIIDGVPVTGLREFYNMNPSDIESVSILKDGAASIYGSRAANGVILIKTKRGAGGMSVNYTNNFRLQTIGIRPPTSDMQSYAAMFLEASNEDGSDYSWNWGGIANLELMRDGYEGIYEGTAWGDIYLANTNRFDETYGNSFSQQHNISISGSTEKTAYRVSAGFADSQGALKLAYDGQKQYNIRMNLDQKVNDRISIQSGIMYQQIDRSGPSTGLEARTVFGDAPLFPAYNPYGQWFANFEVGNRNPTAALVDGGREDFVEDQTKINLGLTVNILDGLDFEVTGSLNKRISRTDDIIINVPLYDWEGNVVNSYNGTPEVRTQYDERTYQNYGGYLKYKKTLGESHNISALAGVTSDLSVSKSLEGVRTGFEDQGIYDLNVAPEDQSVEANGGASHWGLYAYLARVNYDFKGKYLLELIGRRDGSSRFAPGYKWSNYGSVSAGWVLTEESFMQNIPVLSFLKLKASYGELGNQSNIGNYDYVSTISTGSIPFGSTPALQNTAGVGSLTSVERNWERVAMTNFAAEFTLINHKLVGSFDYFIKKNEDMIIPVSYPTVLGDNAPETNSGDLETKGWEAVLGWKDKVGDFSYNISVNMSDSKNKLVRFEGASAYQAGLNSASGNPLEGYALNSYFLYKTDGFFADQEAVDAYYDTYTSVNDGDLSNLGEGSVSGLRPGDTYKVDVDGNGYISSIGEEGTFGDLVYSGESQAHYVFGISSGFQYKGFDFTANFQGVLNQDILRTGHLAYPFRNIWANQSTSWVGSTWNEQNQGAAYPRLTTNTQLAGYNWANNDFALQNNRYIRLKTLVVGYTLPTHLVNRVKVQKARVYFSGNDLWEGTSIKDGYDPEMGESANSVYPFNRAYSLGLDITF